MTFTDLIKKLKISKGYKFRTSKGTYRVIEIYPNFILCRNTTRGWNETFNFGQLLVAKGIIKGEEE